MNLGRRRQEREAYFVTYSELTTETNPGRHSTLAMCLLLIGNIRQSDLNYLL